MFLRKTLTVPLLKSGQQNIIRLRRQLTVDLGLEKVPFVENKMEQHIYTGNIELSELLSCRDRYFSLEKSLNNNNLSVRRDSSLCRNYVLYGVEDIEVVTNTMVEMDFLYNRTVYPSINDCLINSDTYYWDFGDLEEDYRAISEQAKKVVYRSLTRKDVEGAPPHVRRRFNFFRSQKNSGIF